MPSPQPSRPPSRPSARPRPRRLMRLANLVVASALTSVGIVGGWAVSGSAVRPVSAPYVSSASGSAAAPHHGVCGAFVPGEPVLEAYLALVPRKFGAVVKDGRLGGSDCAAVRAFQRWAAIPQVTGAANALTVSVAKRLIAVKTSSCGASGSGLTVCVDLTNQAAWAIRGGVVVLGPTVVRTGRPGEATPTGWFRIGQKKRHTVSSIYGTPLPYWERFYRDYGFHQLEKPMYARIPGSHGCVNMLPRDAAALFALTSPGTRVHLFGRKPGT